jgi:hypothetical protein
MTPFICMTSVTHMELKLIEVSILQAFQRIYVHIKGVNHANH